MSSLINIDAEICQNPREALKREWLLSNGLGGFASSTIMGCNTRKYHGLLIASLTPPTNRFLVLSNYDETVTLEGMKFHLSTNRRPGGFDAATATFQPEGYKFIVNFRLDPFPITTYALIDWEIEKRIFIPYGKNAVVVRYRVIQGRGEASLVLAPLVTYRDIHNVSVGHNLAYPPHITGDNRVVFAPYPDRPSLTFFHNGESIVPINPSVEQLEYPIERERGYDSIDSIVRLCEFKFPLSKEKPAFAIASTAADEAGDAILLEREALRRHRTFVKKAANLHPKKVEIPTLVTLVSAADSFIVKRGGGVSVIAGYPWFTDWGRDTMISLPGIFLLRGRCEQARNLLLAFLQYYKNGLIPNTFPEKGAEPIYNTVDASLWFIHAAYEYYLATKDINTVSTPLFEAVRDIIQHYVSGAHFGIHQDSDGLIYSGEAGWQITWMDVKVGDKVITPRIGKNVEINALWYHALKITAFFADILDDEEAFAAYELHAQKVKKSFVEKFWWADGNCLYDTLGADAPDASIRPNQIFAVSLPHPVLTGEKAKAVFECVTKHLLTPYGLRSLAPGHPEYKSQCAGDLVSRDSAYHQGTVWAWLIGPYIDALVNVKGKAPAVRKEGLRIIEPLLKHLEEAGLGTVSEIFDGDAPHTPRGCYAQAWSVAELLRAYVKLLRLPE